MAQFSVHSSADEQVHGHSAKLGRWPCVFLVNGKALRFSLTLGLSLATRVWAGYDQSQENAISKIYPPEKDFYSKVIIYQGIPIKASQEVTDEAMLAARDRLAIMLTNLSGVCKNLETAHAELHIIGRNQVTSDLPEWRFDKGKSLAEYNGLTIDERTRGMGGRISSCGEENLLKLDGDRYHGRDICVHEFSAPFAWVDRDFGARCAGRRRKRKHGH